MTPEEQLEKLINPRTLEDLGVSVLLGELATAEEGRKLTQTFYEKYVPWLLGCPVSHELTGVKGKV